jgi:DNA polymerase III subunit delta'
MVVGADGVLPLPWLAEPLADTLAHQRAHAVLVHAAPGIGALPFVLTLAQAWLCEDAGSRAPRPCGRCGSCRLLQSHLHPDLVVLLPEVMRQALGWPLAGDKADDGDSEGGKGKRKPSRQIRIDEVRLAIDWVYKTSSRGRGKVLVLHPAEALNVTAANALLKTLEEPPAGTRLLLSAGDPEHLLPTVRSRCQLLRLPPPAAEVSRQWLGERGHREPEVLLAAAGGRPLDALALVEAGIDAAAWTALPRALARGQGGVMAGWPVPRVVDALQKLCVDAMALAAGGTPRYFPASALPPPAEPARLSDWGRSLARIARHDEHPWNEGLLLDALLAEARDALTAARAAGRAFDKLGA